MNKLKLNFLHKIVLFGTLFVMIAGQEYRQGQYPSKTRLFGVTYNPFQLDSFEICLPIKTVESDMKIIKDVADHIRIYTVDVCPEATRAILKAVRTYKMRVIVGLYISGDAASNQKEVDAVRPLVEEFGDLMDCILVGNEVLFFDTVSLDDLLSYVKEVKNQIGRTKYSIPVTTAEVWPVYESPIGKRLVDETDFICTNHQPFWESYDIICPENAPFECATAPEYIHLKAEGLEKFFGKPVWLCESGWPTQGERCCEGKANSRDGFFSGPSEQNTTIFINDLVTFGRADNRPTYIHTIFDESWKRIWSPCLTCEGLSTKKENPNCFSCELDYHYGIYFDDRTPKSGVKLPSAP